MDSKLDSGHDKVARSSTSVSATSEKSVHHRRRSDRHHVKKDLASHNKMLSALLKINMLVGVLGLAFFEQKEPEDERFWAYWEFDIPATFNIILCGIGLYGLIRSREPCIKLFWVGMYSWCVCLVLFLLLRIFGNETIKDLSNVRCRGFFQSHHEESFVACNVHEEPDAWIACCVNIVRLDLQISVMTVCSCIVIVYLLLAAEMRRIHTDLVKSSRPNGDLKPESGNVFLLSPSVLSPPARGSTSSSTANSTIKPRGSSNLKPSGRSQSAKTE